MGIGIRGQFGEGEDGLLVGTPLFEVTEGAHRGVSRSGENWYDLGTQHFLAVYLRSKYRSKLLIVKMARAGPGETTGRWTKKYAANSKKNSRRDWEWDEMTGQKTRPIFEMLRHYW
jgi:hypothetical protein